MKWIWRVGGFALALAAAFLVEYLFFAALSAGTGRHWYPRGAGWLFAPIAAGCFGALIADRYGPKIQSTIGGGTKSQSIKLWALGSALWALAVACYLFIFDPFGSYWSNSEKAFVWKLVFVPPAFGLIALLAVSKVMKPPAGPTAP